MAEKEHAAQLSKRDKKIYVRIKGNIFGIFLIPAADYVAALKMSSRTTGQKQQQQKQKEGLSSKYSIYIEMASPKCN